MKVLLVGGCGYIGSRLAPHLYSLGHDVSIVDLLWFGNHISNRFPVKQQDACELTVDDLRGFHCVIFIAGLSNDPMADHDPLGNFKMNAALPAYLARIARLAGVRRFIHGGSCSVYGLLGDHEATEFDIPLAETPYGISKLMAEVGCAQHADAMSVINLRQGTVAGISPRMRFDLVVNAMVKDALTTKVITVNDPDAWRPLLVIDDAVRAYAAAVAAPLVVSGTYNIATQNLTIMQVAETVQSAVGGRVLIDVLRKTECRSYRVSTAKARDELRWEPRSSVAAVAEALVETYRGTADFDDARFYNIRTFKALQTSPAASNTASISPQRTEPVVLPAPAAAAQMTQAVTLADILR